MTTTSPVGPAPTAPLFAAADLDCRDFPDRGSAQAALDADRSDPNGLDGNGDGEACQSLPARVAGATAAPVARAADVPTRDAVVPAVGAAAIAGRDFDCRDFPDQASAQAALDADPADPFNLDGDGDGIACETGTGGAAAAGARLSGQIDSALALALTGADGVSVLGGALVGAGLAAVALVRRFDPSSIRAAGRHRTSRS